MLPVIPSLSLLLVLVSYWLLCRLYGWHSTLSSSTYAMFFTFGCVGSTLVTLYLQAIPMPFAKEQGTGYAEVAPSTWLTDPAIEEVAKIIPLLIIVGFISVARRLSIADFTLIGFTTGLGFGFVESNFTRVLTSDLFGWQHVLGLGYDMGQRGNYPIYFAGHWTNPALVGLAFGVGVRLWPASYLKWVPGAVMLALVSFDHSMWNYKQQHQYPNSFDPAPALMEGLYTLTMHGFLEVAALPILLIAATLWEAHWSWQGFKGGEALLLPGENGMSPFSELRLFYARRNLGRGVQARTLAYFRHRRALGLAYAESARSGNLDKAAARYAAIAQAKLKGERVLVADPASSPWLPTRAELMRIALAILSRYRMVLVVGFLSILLFAVAPQLLPWLHSSAFAWMIGIIAVCFMLWRMRSFWKARPPDPVRTDGETLLAYRTRAVLLAASAVTTCLPLLALTFRARWFIPGALADMSAHLGAYQQAGGSLIPLLSLGGLAAAVRPLDKPPCQDLQLEVDAGAERIMLLEAALESVSRAGNGLPGIPDPTLPGCALPAAPVGGVTSPMPGGSPTGTICGTPGAIIQEAALPALPEGDASASPAPVNGGSTAPAPENGQPASSPNSRPLKSLLPAEGGPDSEVPPHTYCPAPASSQQPGSAILEQFKATMPDLSPSGTTPGTPVGTGPDLTALQRAETNLAAERAAQQKRLATLATCLQASGITPPTESPQDDDSDSDEGGQDDGLPLPALPKVKLAPVPKAEPLEQQEPEQEEEEEEPEDEPAVPAMTTAGQPSANENKGTEGQDQAPETAPKMESATAAAQTAASATSSAAPPQTTVDNGTGDQDLEDEDGDDLDDPDQDPATTSATSSEMPHTVERPGTGAPLTPEPPAPVDPTTTPEGIAALDKLRRAQEEFQAAQTAYDANPLKGYDQETTTRLISARQNLEIAQSQAPYVVDGRQGSPASWSDADFQARDVLQDVAREQQSIDGLSPEERELAQRGTVMAGQGDQTPADPSLVPTGPGHIEQMLLDKIADIDQKIAAGPGSQLDLNTLTSSRAETLNRLNIYRNSNYDSEALNTYDNTQAFGVMTQTVQKVVDLGSGAAAGEAQTTMSRLSAGVEAPVRISEGTQAQLDEAANAAARAHVQDQLDAAGAGGRSVLAPPQYAGDE